MVYRNGLIIYCKNHVVKGCMCVLLSQVVGFTASLGVGQAKSLDGAVDHVLQVCANHDALIVQSVQREIDDLNMFVTSGVPKSIVEKINDDFPNVFEKKVNEVIKMSYKDVSSGSCY